MSGRTVAAVAAVLVAAGGVTAAVLTLGRPQAEGGTKSPAMPPATAEVTRRTLTDTETKTGTLGYGDSTELAARLSGTLTAVAATGTTVSRGGQLYRVDDDPVTLLYGSLPAYRKLSVGTTGTDVKQFERNLWALGYRGFTVDQTYSSATATAVRKWQKKLGLDRTGSVDPAQVVYAAGPVRVSARSAVAGDAVQPGGKVLTVTGVTRVASVELEIGDQRLARVGAAVEVTLPAGNTVPGRITGAETVVQPGEGQDEDTTVIDVTIGLSGRPKGLDQASVEVEFTAARRKNVLTVPVPALLALAEGGYGVQVVADGTTRLVPVETGLFADGRVEVTGPGLDAGMVVGVPS